MTDQPRADATSDRPDPDEVMDDVPSRFAADQPRDAAPLYAAHSDLPENNAVKRQPRADAIAALTDAIEAQNLYHGRHGTTPAGSATAAAILSCLRNHHGLTIAALAPADPTDGEEHCCGDPSHMSPEYLAALAPADPTPRHDPEYGGFTFKPPLAPADSTADLRAPHIVGYIVGRLLRAGPITKAEYAQKVARDIIDNWPLAASTTEDGS
jgi:hypothetical protein